jgi:hypothetical protein
MRGLIENSHFQSAFSHLSGLENGSMGLIPAKDRAPVLMLVYRAKATKPFEANIFTLPPIRVFLCKRDERLKSVLPRATIFLLDEAVNFPSDVTTSI